MPLDEFESTYEKLILETLPKVKGMILMTPYLMEPNKQDAMRARITLLLLNLKRLAENTGRSHIYNDRKDTMIVTDIFRLVRENYADPDFSLKTISDMMFKSISAFL